MNKSRMILTGVLSLFVSTMAYAATTVTVDDENVSVNPGNSHVVVTNSGTPAQVVTPAQPAVLVAQPGGDYDVQGEIVSIDYPNNEIVVHDVTPSDRRIKGDPSIVATLKVGDRVKVDLRGSGNSNTNEAHRIIEI
jgi:hypothetical protein